ncbi:hypothetical protein GCM10009872_25190 [Actinopolymorpha rutila]
MERPIRRNSPRGPGTRAHHVSWPWVSPTIRFAPARRSVGASRPSGAAAPNSTRSQPSERSTWVVRRASPGVGSSVEVRSRITGNGRVASYSLPPAIDAV